MGREIILDVAANGVLQQRAQAGLEVYGTYLQTDNGRNALIDLYEELLDAYMYATQFEAESPHSRSITPAIIDALRETARELGERGEAPGFLQGRAPQPQPTFHRAKNDTLTSLEKYKTWQDRWKGAGVVYE